MDQSGECGSPAKKVPLSCCPYGPLPGEVRGTAGLPHILARFYTNPDAAQAPPAGGTPRPATEAK